MITLYGSGPMFGMPHASPFVMKAEVLLKLSKLPYQNAKANLRKAPKGKMPWIDDSGKLIADSSFIRRHLEDEYKIDFSGGYDAQTLGHGLALEHLMEDHVYWLNVHNRWLKPDNFVRGPIRFFDEAPALIRPLIARMVLKKVAANSIAHGIGRHTDDERLALAKIAIDAISNILDKNRYVLGDRVSGADATTYGFMLSMCCPLFTSPYADYARTKSNISNYLQHMTAQFYPEFANK
jgi:glutathione S-transferase